MHQQMGLFSDNFLSKIFGVKCKGLIIQTFTRLELLEFLTRKLQLSVCKI